MAEENEAELQSNNLFNLLNNCNSYCLEEIKLYEKRIEARAIELQKNGS